MVDDGEVDGELLLGVAEIVEGSEVEDGVILEGDGVNE